MNNRIDEKMYFNQKDSKICVGLRFNVYTLYCISSIFYFDDNVV